MKNKIPFQLTACCFVIALLCFFGKNTAVFADETQYTGIQIDGEFSDWDAVLKTEVDDEGLNEVAFIFDGEYLYFYIDAKQNWTASNAGPYYNGKYAVTTDLGYVMLFQLKDASSNPYITGITDAQIAHSNLNWGKNSYCYEISVPTSELPFYTEFLSFGLYDMEPYIKDVTDLQGGFGGSDFSGIVYDGSFEDWNYYPHTVIEYSAGADSTVVDGQAALYSDSESLYGHVFTRLNSHLNSAGGEFTSAVTIGINSLPSELFNGYDEEEWLSRWPWNWLSEWSWMWNRLNQYFLKKSNFTPELVFSPMFVTVAEDGKIDYRPKLSNLKRGTYEFYLIDLTGWTSAKYIDELEQEDSLQTAHNAVYGKATIEIGASKDEMEFEIYLDVLARKYDLDIDGIKVFCARFGRIGSQWITCAGTSTGTWIGIALCILVVGFVLIRRKVQDKGAKSLLLTECEPAMQK